MAGANQVMVEKLAQVNVPAERTPSGRPAVQITPSQGKLIFREVRKANGSFSLPLTEQICRDALSNRDGQMNSEDKEKIVFNVRETAVSAVEKAASDRTSGRVGTAIGALLVTVAGAAALFSKDPANLTGSLYSIPIFLLARTGSASKKVASRVNEKILSELDNYEDHAKIPAPSDAGN